MSFVEDIIENILVYFSGHILLYENSAQKMHVVYIYITTSVLCIFIAEHSI